MVAPSEFQLKKMNNGFELFDVNNDGFISREDFEQQLKWWVNSGGVDPSSAKYKQMEKKILEEQWPQIAANADKDHDGKVSREEFLGMLQYTFANPAMYEQLAVQTARDFVAMVDSDGDGELVYDEYAMYFRPYGMKEEDIRAAFDDIDRDERGTITEDELIAAQKNFNLSDDPTVPGTLMYGPID